MLRQALILAGGKGTRLGDLTKETPKPMLEVAGKPFLEYIVWNLSRNNIKNIILSVGYKYNVITEYFCNGKQFGVNIDYIIEEKPLGTGGAIQLANDQLDKEFLVLNGDTLFDINFNEFYRIHCITKALVSIALRRVRDGERYGSVVIENNKIRAFSEKIKSKQAIISGGIYIINKDINQLLPNGKSSLERKVFPKLAHDSQLCGHLFDGFFIDIGLHKSYNAASTLVQNWKNAKENNDDYDYVSIDESEDGN